MRMFRKILMAAFALPLLALAISFAASNASNDSIVSIGLWPWQTRLAMPVWLVGLGGLSLGLVLGGAAMSLPLVFSKWQQDRLSRRITRLAKQQDEADKDASTDKPPDKPAMPRLPWR